MQVQLFRVSNKHMINQCYAIYNTQECILIDPAWECDTILKFIDENHLQVKAVLLTHSHKDHTDLAHFFVNHYSIPCYISQLEKKDYSFECPNLIALQHLEEISIGQFNIKCYLTPGHTSGGMCYHINDHLFTGDTLFMEGVGICHTIGGDPSQMFDSVQFLKTIVSSNTRFWPGHSYGVKAGGDLEKIVSSNLYYVIMNRDSFIKFRMRKNQKSPTLFG